MITLVRKFSIILKGSDRSILPVIYIQEYENGNVQYCVANPMTDHQQFIEREKVDTIHYKDD